VATFGATVQALLVPAGLTESHGTLRKLGLVDIIALQCVGGRTTILDVKGTAGNAGAVHIADGHIFHAETDQQSGVRALTEMFKWPGPRAQETAKRPEEPEKKKREKTGKKIVIVDDTEMLVIFAEDVLSTADAELQITEALTGNDGLKEIERVLPDLVLLDYSLPDINGDEVCRRLLTNEQTARIPVLMMSGHVAEMNATAAKFENVVATIEKPFLSEPFVDLVKRTLAGGPRREPARGRENASKSELKSPGPAKASEAKIGWPMAEEPIPKVLQSGSPTPAAAVAPPASAATPEDVEVPLVVPSVPSISTPFPLKIASPPPVETPTFSALVPASGENEVVLGIFLEVLSMQLTPELRMGVIRARPISPTVSLHFLSPAAPGVLPDSGFQLGATELDEKGRLATLRLIPTAKPFQPAATRNAFEIGGVALVRGDHRARVQLTPAGTTPMTMELLARLELSRVALLPTFQVSHLVLKWRSSLVRITLDPKAPEQSGALFNVAVKLDTSGQISELLLTATK
jgi:CheY-like chemotaxis protein